MQKLGVEHTIGSHYTFTQYSYTECNISYESSATHRSNIDFDFTIITNYLIKIPYWWALQRLLYMINTS